MSLTLLILSHIFLIILKKSFLSQLSGSNFSTQDGISMSISLTGNSLSTCLKTSSTSSSFILATSITWTVTSYLSSSSFFKALVSGEFICFVLSTTIKGFLIAFNSSITLSSASKYSSLSIPVILPSVVTTRPMVEWSVITFLVPISAASSKGISYSYHGVFTILASSPSIYPIAPLTI